MRFRATVIAGCALALAGCAGGSGEREAAAPTTPPAGASATAVARASASALATGSLPPSPAATASSEASAPATAAPWASPGGPAVPRPPGTYRYDTEGTTKISGPVGGTIRIPPETTLRVDPASGYRQRSVRDLRDKDGNGRVTDTRLRYTPEGIRLTYLKIASTVAGIRDERTFQPSPQPFVLRTGTRPGDRTAFTLEGSGITSRTTIDVLRRETLTIGGSRIAALVIRIHTTFSGDYEGEDTAHNWIRPSDGLLLKEDDVSDVRSGTLRARTEYTAVLKSTRPS